MLNVVDGACSKLCHILKSTENYKYFILEEVKQANKLFMTSLNDIFCYVVFQILFWR
jgi:hypothetical protein